MTLDINDEDRALALSLAPLVALMRRLRDPETGCPWDRQQSFGTIAPYTIEEAHEVAEAIARHDLPAICDELGDLALQVVFHARIAQEMRAFTLADVSAGIVAKMIRRHPHVFAGAAEFDWEAEKARERAEKGETPRSTLAGVPTSLPALTRAIKLQKKAAHVGFDWPDVQPVLEKIAEEIAELKAEIARNGAIEEEFGDLLFVMANLARHLKLDPEQALAKANAKFTRRFQAIEAALAAQGRTPAQSDLAEMDALWNAAKAQEKAQQPTD